MNRKLIHAHHFFIINIIFYIMIIFPKTKYLAFSWAIFLFILSLSMGLSILRAFKILLFTLAFSVTIFFLFLFFPSNELKTGEVFSVFGFSFFKVVVENAMTNWLRLWSISVASISTANVLNTDELFFYWMQEKKLPKKLGYAFLMGVYSIKNLKKEWELINLNISLRNSSRKFSFSDRLFPILVSAFRVSLRGAMSLYSRGLSEEKMFYYCHEITMPQSLYFKLLVLALILISLIVFHFFPY